MITIFNRRRVFTAFDMETFTKARDILNKNNIEHKYFASSQAGKYSPAGMVMGGVASNAGAEAGQKIMYDIFVKKIDEAIAFSLLREINAD